MAYIAYKGKVYGETQIVGDEVEFFVQETDELPSEDTPISKVPVYKKDEQGHDTDEQATTEDGKKIFKVTIPISHLIGDANIITGDNASFIIDQAAAQPVELSSGSYYKFGNINGDFVADGWHIINPTEARNELIEEGIENPTIEQCLQRRDVEPWEIYNCDWHGQLIYNIENISGTQEPGLIVKSQHRPTYPSLIVPLSANPVYAGTVFVSNNISTDIDVEGNITGGGVNSIKEVFVILNEQGEILGVKDYSDSAGNQWKTSTAIEAKYNIGLTDTYQHITKEQYDELIGE